MAEESYREYMCKLVYPGCEFAVRAKTEDEVIALAHMHQEIAHNIKEKSPEIEEKIKESIKIVPIRPGDPRVAKKKSLLDTCL